MLFNMVMFGLVFGFAYLYDTNKEFRKKVSDKIKPLKYDWRKNVK